MAGSNKSVLSFAADDALAQEVEEYKEQRDHDSRSDAQRELVEIGLRESKSPILYRAKDQVLEWAAYLSLAAVVTLILGATTSIFTIVKAAQVGLVMVSIALGLVAIVELTRLMNGQSELSDIINL